MYVSLIGFIQVKSQNQKYSAFETHGFFMLFSIVALLSAILTSGILFSTNDPLKYTGRNNIFLKAVCIFSTILAPLSLMLVLYLPSKLNWIGYSIICALFGAMIAYTFYASLRGKKRVSDIEALHMV